MKEKSKTKKLAIDGMVDKKLLLLHFIEMSCSQPDTHLSIEKLFSLEYIFVKEKKLQFFLVSWYISDDIILIVCAKYERIKFNIVEQ